MSTHEISDDDRRVLQALADVEASGEAPSAQKVAQHANAQPTPVRAALNRLHQAGYVDESLKLTDEGRTKLG